MQPVSLKKFRWLKPAMAGLMAAFILALGLFSASSAHHSLLHGGSAANDGSCVVCSIAQGQVDVPHSPQPLIVPPEPVSESLAVTKILPPQSFDYSVALSRGPPVSVVSL